MRKLQQQEVERIAMHFVELNSKPGDSVNRLYELYLSATETISKIESEDTQKHINSTDWNL